MKQLSTTTMGNAGREKFTSLRSFLTVAMARAVTGLTMTDENYDAAVELLQSRF